MARIFRRQGRLRGGGFWAHRLSLLVVVFHLLQVLNPSLVLEFPGGQRGLRVHFFKSLILLGVHEFTLNVFGLLYGSFLVILSVFGDDVESFEVHGDTVLVDRGISL